ncbi:MAG: DNA replication/repair protein RecF [Clostridia bacterium]|nr:DNA replication/repair protein RecF [Clostridia bacterium]MBR4032532.1 DNA replication/repair protein RecF [Clostridia bacterium]
MFCRNIYIENFRNIALADVDFCEGTNVLIGENAQGKTNLLEAIYMTALGKSFRQGTDKDVIKFGEEYCFIKNSYTDSIRDMEISMRVFSDKRAKRVEQNRIKVARTSEMVGCFKVVLFCPEHLSIIKDGPSMRRNFLDVAISQIRPLYMRSLQKYATILKERNALIRDAEENRASFDATIDLFSEQLANEAALITLYRVKYIEKLRKYVSQCFLEMTGERELPEIEYISSCKLSEEDCFDIERCRNAYRELYLSHHDREIGAGSTLWGIHKDDMEISLNGNRARIFASQGQQRSLSLALKLAEGEIIKDECGGDYPVFLFDDVLSELDSGRREYLLSNLHGKQVILTCCEKNDIKADKLIGVSNGIFT